MSNAGNSKLGRMKASITRKARGGLRLPRITPTKTPSATGGAADMTAPTALPVASAPTSTTFPTAGPSTRTYTTRKYRMLGSMKYGGKIQRTGLYLMHRNEVVHSPFTKGKR